MNPNNGSLMNIPAAVLRHGRITKCVRKRGENRGRRQNSGRPKAALV